MKYLLYPSIFFPILFAVFLSIFFCSFFFFFSSPSPTAHLSHLSCLSPPTALISLSPSPFPPSSISFLLLPRFSHHLSLPPSLSSSFSFFFFSPLMSLSLSMVPPPSLVELRRAQVFCAAPLATFVRLRFATQNYFGHPPCSSKLHLSPSLWSPVSISFNHSRAHAAPPSTASQQRWTSKEMERKR